MPSRVNMFQWKQKDRLVVGGHAAGASSVLSREPESLQT